MGLVSAGLTAGPRPVHSAKNPVTAGPAGCGALQLVTADTQPVSFSSNRSVWTNDRLVQPKQLSLVIKMVGVGVGWGNNRKTTIGVQF